MKKLIVITAGALFGIFTLSAFTAGAQSYEMEKKHWKRAKEHDKKREEYYREQHKKRAEYFRERDKKAHEYQKETAKRRKEYWKDARKHQVPGWARAHNYDARHHVFFPDYDAFYDPYRGGYVYRNRSGWSFSVNLPPVLINVDLDRANIRLLRDVPLSRHPEDFYDDYEEEDWDD